jgi:signal transduction histidine kinase
MNIGNRRRRVRFSWLFVLPLFVLCGVLGFLQYRWIGEVRIAARDRLRGTLEASLFRVSREFDSEVVAACAAIAPANSVPDAETARRELESRYNQWKQAAGHGQVFDRIAIATPDKHSLTLRVLDPRSGVLAEADWPAAWIPMKNRLEANLAPRPWPDGNPPPPPESGMGSGGDGFALEVPLVAPPPPRASPVPGRREIAWLIFDLNLDYVRTILLPEILQRHLGTGGNLDYQVEVVTRSTPQAVIYASDPAHSKTIVANADGSIGLFQPQFDSAALRFGWQGMRGRRGPVPGPGPGLGPGRGPVPDSSRWQMFVRHRAGSLEAVVERARLLNLSVTGGVLLLMIATLAALIRYTRRAQTLAELQLDFVAGVSHELRTPLTVIHTAAYNLRGKLAGNPGQVERYGALIQQESGRLKELVEQVLQFAGANAGQVADERKPVSVEAVIREAVESTQSLIAGSRCELETRIDPELPRVFGDAVALRHVLENLVGNAAKYGLDGSNWIGIFAVQVNTADGAAVEIRVADRGPGIPADEQKLIFDPFFRGAQAKQRQVHGTGLGLSLVKRIVRAHGGTIRVKSAPGKGAEFIVRIPVAPVGAAE